MSTAAVVHTPPAPESPSVALARAPRTALLRPVASPTDILAAQEETRAFLAAALVEGRDFGKFPGVDKKSLFKAGAERSCLAFGLVPRFRVVEKEISHDVQVPWRKVKAKYDGPRGNRVKVGEDVTEGVSLGLYRYVIECELLGRDTGEIFGSAIASCSTLESKYIDRPRDAENTVLQMAEKRAFVAVTRTALGLSEQFTQDIEDNPDAFAKRDGGEVDDDTVKCPSCQSAMWDNRAKNDEREREGKKRMPDYKCKDSKCAAVIWDAKKYAEELAAAGKGAGDASAPDTASSTRSTSPAATASTASSTQNGEAPPAATEYQISKILELTDHAAVPEELAEQTRERLKKFLSSARADEILVGLETVIKKATPAPLALVPEDEPVAADGAPITDDLPF